MKKFIIGVLGTILCSSLVLAGNFTTKKVQVKETKKIDDTDSCSVLNCHVSCK